MSDFLDELSMDDSRPVDDDRESEESLSESRPASIEERDAYDEQVASFDLQDFIESVHRSSVTVRLYSRGDIEERISRLRHKGLELFQRGDTVASVKNAEKIQALIDEYHAQHLDVTISEASKAEQARALADAKKAGVTGQHEQTLYVIASQITVPEEITGALLVEWSKSMPKQIKSLVKAWGELQGLDVKGLPVF